jgi:predicted nucleic acid-binding protein
MSQAIMDSGPLVAWFSIRDSHHEWATRIFENLPAGALVCEAVLAEGCHLVAKDVCQRPPS